MQLGIKRQAVAEWRDEQILAAADLINRKALIARAALDQEFRDATARDALFPSALANARIDALTRDMLAPEISAFLRTAALGLTEIDDELLAVSQRLTSEPLIALPPPKDTAEEVAQPSTLDVPAALEDPVGTDEARTSPLWFARFPERLKKGASSLAGSAGSAADTLISDTLGMSERIRSTAVRRIEDEWLNDVDNPASALSKVIAALDETAFSARVVLT